MAAIESLTCSKCNSPRSKYSQTGMCAVCEWQASEDHVALCRSDIENGVRISTRLALTSYTIQCEGCRNFFEAKSQVAKYCSRSCRYKVKKDNGYKPTKSN